MFKRNGLASLDDINDSVWKKIYRRLRFFQEKMLKSFVYPTNYKWPKSPLYNFIRIWEYPYVFFQAKKYNGNAIKMRALDVGSGVTFFPYAVSSLGYQVTALDSDPVGIKAYQRLNKVFNSDVSFIKGDATNMPLDNKSFDFVYCVSVLEHVPDFGKVVEEISRILSDNGMVVFTFDVNLNENKVGLNPSKFNSLMKVIGEKFEPFYGENTTHPLKIINCYNSIFPLYVDNNRLKKALRKLFIKKEPYNITSFGYCGLKK